MGDSVAELARWTYHSLKALAADTYALKANAERGLITCGDDSLTRLLTSMELQIGQLASVTELLNGLASPDSSAEDREELERRLRRLKDKRETQ
jgi:hypothetical protein